MHTAPLLIYWTCFYYIYFLITYFLSFYYYYIEFTSSQVALISQPWNQDSIQKKIPSPPWNPPVIIPQPSNQDSIQEKIHSPSSNSPLAFQVIADYCFWFILSKLSSKIEKIKKNIRLRLMRQPNVKRAAILNDHRILFNLDAGWDNRNAWGYWLHWYDL